MSECLYCGAQLHGDPDVEFFCSPDCSAEYHQALRDNADYEAMTGGPPPDTDCVELPWWKNP